MKPSDIPTDPRLFPTELNHTAELDAKALDAIGSLLRRWLNEQDDYDAIELLKAISDRVTATGREV